MKTALLKIAVIALLALVGGFQFASASPIWSNPATTAIDQGYTQIPVSGFPNTGNFGSFSMFLGKHIVNTYYSDCNVSDSSYSPQIRFHSAAGFTPLATMDSYLSSLPFDTTAIATFQFSTSVPLSTYHDIDYVELQTPGGFQCWWHFDTKNMIAYDENGSAITEGISFQNPPFYEHMKSPDFKNWQVCINIPSTTGATAYDAWVTYGTSTPSHTDKVSDSLGEVPIYHGSIDNDCIIIKKQASSTPGTYTAKAYLYDQDGAQLAASNDYHYEITGGDPVTYPNQETVKMPDCEATTWTVAGADFGYGFCKMIKFVFTPPSGIVNMFSNLAEQNHDKVPISFYYEIADAVNNSGTGSTTTLPSIAVTTSATSSIPNLNISIFSPTTLNNASGYSGFSLLRGLASVVLYVGWGFLLYETAILLFKRKEQA